MSEGGYFPWKRQSIIGTPGDYSTLSSPLPPLPKGYSWVRNPETREWSVNCVVDDGTGEESKHFDEGGLVLDSSLNVTGEGKLPDECDYVQHQVQKSDTFQGICLKYGITPVSLRQVNKFSGSNLSFAPELLIIPLSRKLNDGTKTKADSTPLAKEEKLNQFIRTFQKHRASNLVSRKEAQAYLDMNDGNLEMAIKDAKADFGWELGKDETTGLLE